VHFPGCIFRLYLTNAKSNWIHFEVYEIKGMNPNWISLFLN
jgi:hypothetical protein